MALEGLQPLLRPIPHKGEARLRASAGGGRWKETQARQVLELAVNEAGVVKAVEAAGLAALVPRLRRHPAVEVAALVPRLRRHPPVGLLTLGRRMREPLAAGLATLLPRLLERLVVGVQAQRAVAKECITRRAHAGSNLKVAYAQAGL